jgi:hypothetical protein
VRVRFGVVPVELALRNVTISSKMTVGAKPYSLAMLLMATTAMVAAAAVGVNMHHRRRSSAVTVKHHASLHLPLSRRN